MLIKKDSDIILKNVHCPYCQSDEAVLVNKSSEIITSIQLPQYGLKYIISLFYLSLLYMWIHGYKIIERKNTFKTETFGFCPKCGNSYSITPNEEEHAVFEEEKFYRSANGKVILGVCKGISDYTGISLRWIRIMTVIYGLTVIGTIAYFIIALCVPYRENITSSNNE